MKVKCSNGLIFHKSLLAVILEPKEFQQQIVIHNYQQHSDLNAEADLTPAYSLHKCNQTLSSRRLALANARDKDIVSPNKSIGSFDSYMTFIPEVLF